MTVISIHQQPQELPFINAVSTRFNLRVSREEETLLAIYERYWLMTRVLGPLEGAEKRYVKRLARKHNSFLHQRL
ncbi:MAG: hypothetical protein MI867_30270 [Pseudomonadales bacterium]|nr:hypothetical protein [Pseudomonadales bacterium]